MDILKNKKSLGKQPSVTKKVSKTNQSTVSLPSVDDEEVNIQKALNIEITDDYEDDDFHIYFDRA